MASNHGIYSAFLTSALTTSFDVKILTSRRQCEKAFMRRVQILSRDAALLPATQRVSLRSYATRDATSVNHTAPLRQRL